MERGQKKKKLNIRRIDRLIRLLGALQGGRPRNVDSLVDECRVTRRTIFRDLETLKHCGLEILFDEQQQGYRLSQRHFLPPTNFTTDEALALIVLCHELGGAGKVPFHEAAQAAAAKLECSLPAQMRTQLREIAGAVRINREPINPLDNHRSSYDSLMRAISRRRCVRIHYSPPGGEPAFATKLSPFQLLFSRRSWYVIGRSSLHRATRTFNVGRITGLEELDEKFSLPRGFSLQRYLRNAWHLIPEPGPDYRVVVRFSQMMADNVAEVAWHKSQVATFDADGSLRFEVTVSGLWEISWWIMGYGEHAEVLEPPELRTIIADRARRMVEQYAEKR